MPEPVAPPPPALPPGRRRGGIARRLWTAAAGLAAAGLTAATVAGALGGWHWRLDYFANFPLQVFGLGLPTLGVLLLRRRWRTSVAFAGVLAWNAWLLLPLVIGGTHADATAAAPGLRIVQKNVWHSNERYDATVAWLHGQRADVIVVQEMNDAWRAVLTTELTGGGGFRVYAPPRPAGERHVTAVFVRDGLPVQGHRFWGAAEPRKPMVEVVLDVPGHALPVTLQGLHTRAPVRAGWVASRGRQLAELTGWAAGRQGHTHGPTLVVGDLNATRWSAPLRALMRHGGLRDTAEGGGAASLPGTWPAFHQSRFGRFRTGFSGMITLDHVLASGHFAVRERTVGPGLGSDHRGVTVELVPAGGGG